MSELQPRDAASDRAELIEALFHGYKVLGFDTDDCKDGACFLAHTGPGGHNIDAFIALMKRSFDEASMDREAELAEAWAAGAQAGFESTVEGFNGECAFDHLAPDGYPLTNPYSGEKWEVADHDA